ncbi:MAG: hypothetical protein ABJZ55_07795 [Fuerstiella sp.]
MLLDETDFDQGDLGQKYDIFRICVIRKMSVAVGMKTIREV